MSQPDMRSLLRLGRPVAAERGRLALSVAFAAGAAAAAIALLATSGYLISRAAQRPQILALMVTIVAVRAFGITRAALRYAERLASHDLALRQLARLRRLLYARLAPLVPAALAARRGDLLSSFVADVDALQDLQVRVVIPALVSLLVIAGASIAAWLILPAAGVVVLASLLAAALSLPLLGATVASRAARRQAPARARLTSELVETIDGAAELALAGRGGERAAMLRASDMRLARIARVDALAVSASALAGGAISAAGVIALLLVAIPAVHAGTLNPVLLAALLLLLLAAYDSVLPLSTAARRLRGCAASAGRLQELTGRRADVADPERPLHPGGSGTLCLEEVSLRYGPQEPSVLRHATLRIARGEHIALLGPSGSGKSTIAELLVRFRDPSEGRVSLDGVDLRELAQSDLREAVVLCGQDAHVFNTSIRENLLIGRRDARQEELERALAAVDLERWVASLPNGIDTVLGQGGELASGGQRRRIALARALLCRARFLILDEPTAHLDERLARTVMRGVLAFCEDRGMLVITHDLTALEDLDRVLHMRQGAPLAEPFAAPPSLGEQRELSAAGCETYG